MSDEVVKKKGRPRKVKADESKAEVTLPEIPLEERFLAIENQGYVSYLMINSLVKILSEREIIEKDDLAKEMDELNERLFELTQQLVENEKAEGN